MLCAGTQGENNSRKTTYNWCFTDAVRTEAKRRTKERVGGAI
jgi:hypothetical protein